MSPNETFGGPQERNQRPSSCQGKTSNRCLSGAPLMRFQAVTTPCWAKHGKWVLLAEKEICVFPFGSCPKASKHPKNHTTPHKTKAPTAKCLRKARLSIFKPWARGASLLCLSPPVTWDTRTRLLLDLGGVLTAASILGQTHHHQIT